ncbi:FHIPEP family type III secretion protein, partial [Salmonella enterica subsp. enterica serovar Anatum]|nr:FHIPEP family type III secretion protein [Salmonella enterica subsp. enterica serovar Anatum]
VLLIAIVMMLLPLPTWMVDILITINLMFSVILLLIAIYLSDPGNYDEYMTAATQARERLLADNAKKKAQIAELQSFVSRFSANA